MAVAVYFLDKLALRAGHEKDEDEADTVGCCTLKVNRPDQTRPHGGTAGAQQLMGVKLPQLAALNQ
jgi:DNA topoisomerase IB